MMTWLITNTRPGVSLPQEMDNVLSSGSEVLDEENSDELPKADDVPTILDMLERLAAGSGNDGSGSATSRIDISKIGVTDVVESDDEVRADYLEQYSSAFNNICAAQDERGSATEPRTSTEYLSDMIPSTSIAASSEQGIDYTDQPSAHSDNSSQHHSASQSRPHSAGEIMQDVPLHSPDLIETHEVTDEQELCENMPSEPRPGSSHSSDFSDTSTLQLFNDAFSDSPKEGPSASCCPTTELIEAGLDRLRKLLFPPWVPLADQCGYHILLVSQTNPKAVQRDVFISYEGKVTITVHCVELCKEKDFLVIIPQLTCKEVVSQFCESCLVVVKLVAQFDVCVGANDEETKSVWGQISHAYIDRNPYQEMKYVETCRSVRCARLVELGNRTLRCVQCSKVMKSLIQRKKFLLSESADSSTCNIFLTPTQAFRKVQDQHIEIRKKEKQLAYLRTKLQKICENEGVDIDAPLHGDLVNILSECKKLSEVQKMFLEEQLKFCSKAESHAHRWHPSMIRLALHLKMTSMTPEPSTAYEALRESGVIKLPCSRTLFDYSRDISSQGVPDGLINLVHQRVIKLEHEYQLYHSLICDEMHISQSLVYRKSDGHLMGYIHLEDFEREWQRFDNLVSGKETDNNHSDMATSILAFMVKSLTTDVKCVVAAFPCKTLNQDMMYDRSWQVISRLERARIKVLTFVCDGNAVNLSFIRLHTPITKTASGIIFDTLNVCSEDERPLFFISDVCHLLKATRNAFYNSGPDENKTRCLQYNEENICWKSVIRLYLAYGGNNLRPSYKLNAQNVFPNSYSQMRVHLAAEVLSETVATDMEAQNWPNHTEIVKFIRYFNKFFDCLNGTLSKEAFLRKNPDLAPYTSVDDERFDWLQSFLNYLDDWKKQAAQLPFPPHVKAKTILPRQTLEGLEIAVGGFSSATKYLLNDGIKYVRARAFSQDPLEQHFRLRKVGIKGGRRNPNVCQFLSKQVSTAVQQNLGVRTGKSNVRDEGSTGMEATEEPPMKRARKLPVTRSKTKK